MTISVRYEHSNDLKFLKDMTGLGLGARVTRLSISEYKDLLKEYKIQINIDIEDAKKSLEYARMNL